MRYDKTDKASIENFAKELVGQTFLDVLDAVISDEEFRNECIIKYSNPRRKGGLGNFLEEMYFGYKANSSSLPDFSEAGVELKVTPYEINKKGKYKVGERTVLTMIDNKNPVEKDFYQSHLWQKIRLLLLVFYLRTRQVEINLEYMIDYVSLFTPQAEDLAIIIEDYYKIISKIEAGNAHELSESDTMYLAACTKGASAEKSLAPQYYNPEILAKRRAFSFKPSYMNSVLHDLIAKSEEEHIVKDAESLKHTTFENLVINRIKEHIGRTDKELCRMFEREYNNNKSQWVDLSFRMLGIKSNKAEEFTKANIVVKTIRLESENKMKESLSFPVFRFKELICEEWETSTICEYFEQTKFLFVVFMKQGEEYVLSNVKFWNMSTSDLEGAVRECWEKTVDKIKTGVTFRKSGNRIFNDLPSAQDNPIMHVRPHAKKSAYSLADGTKFGNLERDANPLPDGQWMTNQCFWLNNTYILEQLKG